MSVIEGFCRDKNGTISMVRYTKYCLYDQRIKLLRSSPLDFCVFHLPLPDHVHHFDAGQNDLGATIILEAHHRFDDRFDGPVVLLDDVVQVLDLTDLDGRFRFGVDGLEGRQICYTFIHGNRLRYAVLADSFLEVVTRSSLLATSSQQKINGLSGPVYRPVEIFLFTTDLDIGLTGRPDRCELSHALRSR